MKYLKMLIFLFLSLITINVNASMVSVDDFIDGYNNSDIVKLIAAFGDDENPNVVRVVKDEENHKLNVKANDEDIFYFEYTDEYIQFSDSTTQLSKETVSDPIMILKEMLIENMLDALLDVTNHSDKTLSFPENINQIDLFNSYGIAFAYEPFSFENDDNSTINGNYIRLIKITLDSEKIDNLVTNYGVNRASTQEVPTGLIPTIYVDNVQETSASIHFSLETDDQYMCQIYRSTSENGEYLAISNGIAINCNGVTISDDLSSNTTYYYKGKIVGSEEYSNVVSITTKSSQTQNTTSNDEIVNPKTGVASSFAFMSILLVLSIVCLVIVTRSIHSKII